MTYTTIMPLPGVFTDIDEYTAGTHWIATDKIRFDQSGLPEKIGGWTKFDSAKVAGTARTLHDWRELDGNVNLAVGTNCALYIYQGGVQYNITPVRSAGNNITTTPFTSVDEDFTVTVADTSHGASTGDFVFFTLGGTDPKVFNGVTIAGATWYTLIKVDDNSYTIESSTVATSSGTNSAAGTVSADYSLVCGPAQTTAGLGWGASTWNESGTTWNTARTSSTISLTMQVYSLDNWGEDLLSCPVGGIIYTWDASSAPSTSNVATVLSGAPSQVNLMGVSPDRFTIAFGAHDGSAYDPLLIAWSDQENNTTWTPSATNQAGSKKIESGTKIMAWEQAARQILIFTDESMWGMQFLGPPFVFSFQELGTKCGAAGPNAVASLGGITYWMSTNNFFTYDGAVKILPSTVRDFVFDGLDASQLEQAFVSTIKEFNEVWFFYASSGASDVDRYVVFNDHSKVWYTGTLDRLAWMDTNLQTKPIAVNAAGQLYFQEEGSDDDGSAMTAFCETGAYEYNEGNSMVFQDKVVPAFKSMTGTMTFTTYAKQYPNSTERSKSRSVTSSTKFIRPRMRGRQFRFKWQTSDLGNAWTMGKWRANPQVDGDR